MKLHIIIYVNKVSLIVTFYVVTDHCINFSSAIIHTHTHCFCYRNRKGTRHQEFPSRNTAPRRQAPPPRRPRTATEHHLQRQATVTELLAGVVPTEPPLYNVHTVNSEGSASSSHALQLTTTKAEPPGIQRRIKKKKYY